MADEETTTTRRTRHSRLRGSVRILGELSITIGVVLLLFVVYTLYVTDWFTAREQADARAQLRHRWHDREALGSATEPAVDPLGRQRPPRTDSPAPRAGEPFAQLRIPRFGEQYRFAVLEGTDTDTLSNGPGHYTETQLPGQRGNFALAGHRIGRGAPFNELDELQTCDAIIVETAKEWYVYRMLPVPGAEPASGDPTGGAPRCGGAQRLGGPYEHALGRRIVPPDRYDAVHPVPGKPLGTVPPERRARLITLTTCHPEFSDAQRMIVHGTLTKHYPKVPGWPDLRPPELGPPELGPPELGPPELGGR